MWRKKRGRPPPPALDLRPAFPVIKLTIGLYLPNVGLMLAQCRGRGTNNKVTLGESQILRNVKCTSSVVIKCGHGR